MFIRSPLYTCAKNLICTGKFPYDSGGYKNGAQNDAQYHENDQEAEIGPRKVPQVLILGSAQRKDDQHDESYTRDSKQQLVAEIPPHADGAVLLWNYNGTEIRRGVNGGTFLGDVGVGGSVICIWHNDALLIKVE